MKRIRTTLCAMLVMAVATPALAHPHVFVDAGVELHLGADGRLQAVRIVWVYDDLTSLMILTDRGLDPDGDGSLTPEEAATLRGFDMNWVPGFAGDTYLLQADRALSLGPPQDWTAEVRQGRVISTHVRRLDTPADPAEAPVLVQIYDPGYYTAYTIAAEPLLRGGRDCLAEVYGPDLASAEAALKAAMAELSGLDPETDFPAIGEHYAEEVRLTCPQE